MISQTGDSVTIGGRSTVGAAYRAVLLGIARRRTNGLPAHDLQDLAVALYRAYNMSPQRPEFADPSHSPQDSNHDLGGDWIDSAEAARLLAVNRRQVQRLAASGALLSHRVGSIWLISRAAAQAYPHRKASA